MILHQQDWSWHQGAIADTKTSNSSFILYTRTLQQMGIENHAWPLALHEPILQGVDPFNPKLTQEEVALISKEAKFNYWYHLREIARVGQSGTSVPGIYLANRANMALNWLFLNNIDSVLIMPRQCGKSVGADILNNWLMHVGGSSLSIQLLTRGDDLRVKNIKRLKQIRDFLPAYLNFYQKGVDPNNLERLGCAVLNNEYLTAVAQKDKGRADSVGRGLTSAILQVDEAPYCPNIDISLGVMFASAGRAREDAEANGSFYGNTITTTAGKKDTREGKFMYDLIHECMYWNESLFDAGNRERSWKMVLDHHKGEFPSRMVNCTFSHRQIGKSDEWLRTRIAESKQAREGIERDFLNIWTSGSETSPLSTALNNIIRESEKDPTYFQKFKGNQVLKWVIDTSTIRQRITTTHIGIGVDTSDAGGGDGFGIVLTDLQNMETIATTVINQVNIVEIAMMIAEVIILFPNSTGIIEKKSSGQAVMDIIALELIQAGINPFKRLFNRLVDAADGNPQYEADIKSIMKASGLELERWYTKYKSLFGYNTSGQSRPILYGQVFRSAAQNCGHLVNAKELVDQVLALIEKNGRIDHPAGGHDDLVIGWLLNHWFSIFARNVHYYDIRPGIMQSLVTEDGAEIPEEEIEEKRERTRTIKRINDLKARMVKTDDLLTLRSLELQIRNLASQLGDFEAANILSEMQEQMKEKAKQKKKKNNQGPSYYY